MEQKCNAVEPGDKLSFLGSVGIVDYIVLDSDGCKTIYLKAPSAETVKKSILTKKTKKYKLLEHK